MAFSIANRREPLYGKSLLRESIICVILQEVVLECKKTRNLTERKIMKYVLGARDLASANILNPLIPLLLQSGHKLYICAEGKALQRFDDAGIVIDFRGTVNDKTHPFEFDADGLLEREKPDKVIVGLGSPIYTERLLALAANRKGIPVVMLEDFWGSTLVRANDAKPDLLLVVDEYARELGQIAFPNARMEIIGDAAAVLPPFTNVPAFSRIRQKFDVIVVFFGGGPDDSEEMTRLLIASLEKTTDKWCLIPRFHPKVVDLPSPDGCTYGQVWGDLLSPIADRVEKPDVRSSEVVVLHSDIIVSNFSKLLGTAAMAGKVALSLRTPAGVAIMKKETGYDSVPHVKMGCVQEVTAPVDFMSFSSVHPARIAKKIRPYDPEIALEAIEKL